MTKEEEKVIEKLEAKIKKYKEILDEVMAAPKQIGHVTAGPINEDNKIYYRVSVGSSNLVTTFKDEEIMFKRKERKPLEIGTEVVLMNGFIVAVTPNPLKVLEEVPQFKLISWGEIGGLKSQVDTIRDAIELPLKNEKLVKELGLAPMKGILLYGPPGCGKTLIGKAIASTILNATSVDPRAFVYVKGAELLSMWVGRTEERIAEMFKNCREYTAKTGKRAIIFIDEAESIVPRRGSGRSSDVEKTIVPVFLAEMDGLNEHNPFVLLSTNLPSNIDEAILREGRIDIQIGINRPTKGDVEEIFEIHFKNVKCHDDIKKLSKEATNKLSEHKAWDRISGAMCETVVKFSIQKALKRKIKDPKCKTGVIMQDLEPALAMLN